MPDHPKGADLLSEGRALRRDWAVGPSAFLTHCGIASERDYRLAAMVDGRVMCHAQIGWRDPAKSIRAYREIWETCAKAGHRVDRHWLCLDWSMAMPRSVRAKAQCGTGMILRGSKDSAALANAAPVAHFGDFVRGFLRRWRTRNVPWRWGRQRSAILASISPSVCRAMTTTSGPRRPRSGRLA